MISNGDNIPPHVPLKTATIAKPRPVRPEEVDRAVDTAFAEMAQLRIDRDEAFAERDRAKGLCSQAADSIRKLNEEISELKSRITIYQLERDEAVTRHGILRGFFVSIQAQLDAFGIKQPAPAQIVATDAEAPKLPTHDEVMRVVKRDFGMEKL